MSSLAINASHPPFFPAGVADKKAAVMRHITDSERLGAVRPASRLEVRPRPEMLSTGIAAVDAITSGGLPRGCVSEICGSASSGKTSLLLATLAAATRRAENCVLIDASDSFDPASGAAAGLDFSKLLWIRCGKRKPHKARAGTPVSPNTIFVEARASSPVQKLEQVLKTTDLILQSGGFGLVVLDLAGIPDMFVRRIPLASWFRFQRTVESAKTVLLVVSESPRTQSCATLVIKLCNQLSAISYQLSGKPSHVQVLEDMRVEAEVVRSRLERKPMQSVTMEFKTQPIRTG